MARLEFFLKSYVAAACFEPSSVELHWIGTFAGCSTDLATAPRLLFNRYISLLKADLSFKSNLAVFECPSLVSKVVRSNPAAVRFLVLSMKRSAMR